MACLMFSNPFMQNTSLYKILLDDYSILELVYFEHAMTGALLFAAALVILDKFYDQATMKSSFVSLVALSVIGVCFERLRFLSQRKGYSLVVDQWYLASFVMLAAASALFCSVIIPFYAEVRNKNHNEKGLVPSFIKDSTDIYLYSYVLIAIVTIGAVLLDGLAIYWQKVSLRQYTYILQTVIIIFTTIMIKTYFCVLIFMDVAFERTFRSTDIVQSIKKQQVV